MKFTVEIRARGTSLARMHEIYFSPEFDRAVAEETGLLAREECERSTLDDGRERVRTRVVPRIALPLAVQKAIQGKAIRYDEVVIFDPRSNTADFSIRSVAGKRVQVNGTIAFIEEGTDVRLRFDGEARIRIFGVGSMLERYLVGEVTGRYAKAENVVQRFVDASPS